MGKTGIQRHLSAPEEEQLLDMSADQGELRSVEAGAASIVWALVAPEVASHNGCYVASCAVADDQRAAHASDLATAAQLWDATETLLARRR